MVTGNHQRHKLLTEGTSTSSEFHSGRARIFEIEDDQGEDPDISLRSRQGPRDARPPFRWAAKGANNIAERIVSRHHASIRRFTLGSGFSGPGYSRSPRSTRLRSARGRTPRTSIWPTLFPTPPRHRILPISSASDSNNGRRNWRHFTTVGSCGRMGACCLKSVQMQAPKISRKPTWRMEATPCKTGRR